jgi:hypothetical protein
LPKLIRALSLRESLKSSSESWIQLPRRVVIPDHLPPVPSLDVAKNGSQTGRKLRSKTIRAETHSRCRRKAWVQRISSCFVAGIVRFVLPRSAGKQKTADLHQAGGWCFQLENSLFTSFRGSHRRFISSPLWHLGVSAARSPCHFPDNSGC